MAPNLRHSFGNMPVISSVRSRGHRSPPVSSLSGARRLAHPGFLGFKQTCTSGTVRDEDGNILIYSARPPVFVQMPCAAGIRNPAQKRTFAVAVAIPTKGLLRHTAGDTRAAATQGQRLVGIIVGASVDHD